MSDPFAQALHDHHVGEQDGPLRYRHGEQTNKADIELYFQAFHLDEDGWLASWLDGSLLDMGAGVGRHALALQERFETVAIEHHELLIERCVTGGSPTHGRRICSHSVRRLSAIDSSRHSQSGHR